MMCTYIRCVFNDVHLHQRCFQRCALLGVLQVVLLVQHLRNEGCRRHHGTTVTVSSNLELRFSGTEFLSAVMLLRSLSTV